MDGKDVVNKTLLKRYNFRETDSKLDNCWNCLYCYPGYRISRPDSTKNRCKKYSIEVNENQVCDQFD